MGYMWIDAELLLGKTAFHSEHHMIGGRREVQIE